MSFNAISKDAMLSSYFIDAYFKPIINILLYILLEF